jgi:hypothetical protein
VSTSRGSSGVQVLVDLGRDRRAAAGTRAQIGEELVVAMALLRSHERVEERHRRAEQRGSVRSHALGRGRGIEHVEQHESHAADEAHGEHGAAADVRERPRDRVDVALVEADEIEHARRRGHDRQIGVACAFGVGGGARGVVVPTHERAAVDRRGWRRKCRGIALRKPDGAGHGRRGQIEADRAEPDVVADATREPAVIKASPRLGRDEEVRTDLARDEPDLAFAQDGDDGVLHHIEPGERAHEHRCFEHRGDLPRHDRAGTDAQRGQARGRAFGFVAEACGTERAAVVVGQDDVITEAFGCVFDQRPVGRRVTRHRWTPWSAKGEEKVDGG